MQKELLTVGKLANLMGITVRTLQYYDKEGLLKPSSTSNGGRRLYSAKDIVKLHQILSFKYLGFSLDAIKNKLFSLDSPDEVASLLNQQRLAIEDQIVELQKGLEAITTLHSEVLSIKKVDFTKYAEIIGLLKNGNDGYWVWKIFNDPLKDHIQNRFGNNSEDALKVFDTYKEVLDEAIVLKHAGESPDSEKSIKMATKWWNMILEFTGGDMSLIPELESFNNNKDAWDNKIAEKQKEVDTYLESALNAYFAGLERK